MKTTSICNPLLSFVFNDFSFVVSFGIYLISSFVKYLMYLQHFIFCYANLKLSFIFCKV